MLLLSDADIQKVLTMEMCVTSLEQAYRELAAGDAVTRPRSHTRVPLENERYYNFKSMEGATRSTGVMALRISSDMIERQDFMGMSRLVKLPMAPGNRFVGFDMIFSINELRLLAMMPDDFVQKMRVAGSAAVATKYLARKNASVVGLFGSGWQASSAALAIPLVRQITKIKVYSPNKERREKFAREMQLQTGTDFEAVNHPEQALEGADIVYEATNSRSPVFGGTKIAPGTHINTISDAVDEATIKKARIIAVRQTQAPLFFTMGNVEIPYETPELSHAYDDKVCRLGEIITGKEPGRMNDTDVTYYGVSTGDMGVGIEFAAVCSKIYEQAVAQGLGREFPDDWFLQEKHS
jgi:alanine dehydrogenase